ncbi:MAG: response regulator transcription factor [Actinobacteria bacterium]|nr:response regulator transcription factor [Actinomycetota bacterium]
MTAPRALLVEDSKEFQLLGRRLLEREGFSVTVADNGLHGLALAREIDPEIVLLDVSLPGLDGLEVCRRLREFSSAYVIMVTGRTDEVDRVVGLTIGADDYVTKPFSSRELAARIQAMRRRPRPTERHLPSVFGGLRVDVEGRAVELDGSPLPLTRIEFDILATLVSKPGRVYARSQLMDQVWGGDWFGDDHVIDVHVGNLRKKLGETASSPRFVHTVRGVGFKFVAPAE